MIQRFVEAGLINKFLNDLLEDAARKARRGNVESVSNELLEGFQEVGINVFKAVISCLGIFL